MKKLILLVYFILSITLLSGCRWISDSYNKIRDYSNEFLTYIVNEDYESAKKILHVDCTPNPALLEYNIDIFEQAYGVDFSNGYTLSKLFDFEIIGYSSEYNGSYYEGEFDITIDGKEFEFTIVILENKVDSGIYRYEFEV